MSIALHWIIFVKKSANQEKQIRENLKIGRTLFHYLTGDFKTAGYKGCRSLDSNFPLRRLFVNYGAYKFFQNEHIVFGTQSMGQGLKELPESICKRARIKSDILIIYNVPKKISSLQQDMKDAEDIIYTKNDSKIQSGSIALISDHLEGDLFIVTEAKNQKIYHHKRPLANISSKLSKAYKANAEVIELQTIAYYLGLPKRKKVDPLFKPISYSLYRDDFLHKAEEILEGIKTFEVEYCVNEPLNASYFLKTSTMRDDQWQYVTGVRVTIRTEYEKEWQYEIAIRNRYGLNLSHYCSFHAFLAYNSSS